MNGQRILSALVALCMLSLLSLTAAWAQTPAPARKPPAATAAACPAASEMKAANLYGLWRADFGTGQPGATILFERHPDMGGSVRGGVNRDGVKGLLAGDVHEGELSLDESDDGIKIAAYWSGNVTENSCGKEITGTWTRTSDDKSLNFVLRKVPGWQ